jgi:hypothetical protein
MKRLRYIVSFAALDLVEGQVDLAIRSLDRNEAPRHCTGSFNRQYGLPCWHVIRALIQRNAQLVEGNVNSHWRLKEEVSLDL